MNDRSNLSYKRILLKISGEMLMGKQDFGICHTDCLLLAKSLLLLQQQGLEIAVVIGGGNIFRGISLEACGMQRSPADQMGMLATLINGIALQQAIQALGGNVGIMSALECPKVADLFHWHKAIELLQSGSILIFVGGTGNPYFTTDSAAALRACEINADILIKATKVDGIYDKDPLKNPNAKKYSVISYSQALSEELGVMDATALALCRSNRLPIYICNMQRLLEYPENGNQLFNQELGSFVKEI